MSKCLLIVGMHRSGTSLTSSILQRAGLFVGDNLMQGDLNNTNGYFENMDFFNFHVRALSHLSLHPDGWDTEIITALPENYIEEAKQLILKNQRSQWGWKDPRTTLFLDFWQKLIPDLSFLFVYRAPWEVADSLYRRNTDAEIIHNSTVSFKSWTFYNQTILDFYKKNKNKSLLIHIDDFTKNTTATISEINNRFGFKLSTTGFENIFDASLYKGDEENSFRIWQTGTLFPESLTAYNELRILNGKSIIELPLLSALSPSAFLNDWQQISVNYKKTKELTSEIHQVKNNLETLESDKNDLVKKSEQDQKEIIGLNIAQKELKNKSEQQQQDIKHLKVTLEESNKLNIQLQQQLDESNAMNVHHQKEIDWMQKTFFWKLRMFWKKILGHQSKN